MPPLQRLAGLIGVARFLRLISLWPPYLGAGVRVRHAAPDLSRLEVELRLTRWNRNYVGTQFGGSLYSMCDPFFMLMLMTRLGPDYVVWDKSARIEFLRPGRGTVRATFLLEPERVEEIRREADLGRKAYPRFEVLVVDESGTEIARVEKKLYVRRKEAGAALSRPIEPSATAG